MEQRLGIAAALLGDPPVLLLDEPVNGLDPDGIVWIRGLMRSLAAEGRTVLVSSHLMSELQDTADHVIVIGRGRLLADASVADLLARVADGRVSLRTPDVAEAMTELANAGGRVTSSEDGALTVTRLDMERVGRLLAERGLRVSELSRERPTLEDAYLRLTRESTGYEEV
jgi:ABC-2 type transport system ATP-binding protein